jgi:hypothetical protein
VSALKIDQLVHSHLKNVCLFFFFFDEFNVAVRYYAVLEKSRLKTRLASVAVSGTEQCKRSSH